MADAPGTSTGIDYYGLGNAIAGGIGSAMQSDPMQRNAFTGSVSPQAMMEKLPMLFDLGIAQALGRMSSPTVAPAVTGASEMRGQQNIPGLDMSFGFNPGMLDAFSAPRVMAPPALDPALLSLFNMGRTSLTGNNTPGPLAGEGPMTPQQRASYGPGLAGQAAWQGADQGPSNRGRYDPSSMPRPQSENVGRLPGFSGPWPDAGIMGQIGMGLMPYGTGAILQEVLRRRREGRQEGGR